MRQIFGKLCGQVLIGVFAGVALGYSHPGLGVGVKPLGDVFIKLIKMVFAPIIFATLFGVALSHIGPRAKPVVDFLGAFSHGVFSIVGMIMRLAPLAAFGTVAIARWVGAVDRERLTPVLDGKTDPEDFHALHEGEDAPRKLRPLSASRAAA